MMRPTILILYLLLCSTAAGQIRYQKHYPTPVRDFLFGDSVIVAADQSQRCPPHGHRTQTAAREYWQWTPPAEYHAAVLQIQAGNAGGTGVLIDADNGLVMTAAHVVEGHNQATAIWPNGYRSTGGIIRRDESADAAVFRVDPPDGAIAIPLASEAMKLPVPVECCGYGGPSDRLRHWSSSIERNDGRDLYAQTYALSGDSGGPILCQTDDGPRVISLIEGSPEAYSVGLVIGGSDWRLHTPVRCTKWNELQRLTTQCTPYGCPPYSGPSLPAAPPSIPYCPPALTPIQKPDVVTIDYQKLLDMMAADGRFTGPPGLAGVPGTGLAIEQRQELVIDVAAQVIAEQRSQPVVINEATLDEITARVRARIVGEIRYEVVPE